LSTLKVAIEIALMFFVIVTVHEWGHFYFAKRAGILVREFAIGFGPKLFSYKRGETRYTLRLLPIGGFVRMAGEDPEIVHIQPGQTIALKVEDGRATRIYLDQLDQRPETVRGVVGLIDLERKLKIELETDGERRLYAVHPKAMMVARGKETQIAPLDRQFASKSVGQRALSIAAGPVMNFLLAALLFFIFMMMSGVAKNVRLDSVDPNKAAARAGLMAGDIVVAVDGVQIGADRKKLTDLIQSSPGRKMTWTVQRGQEQRRIEVTPDNEGGVGLVGVTIVSDMRRATVGESLNGAANLMVNSTKQILIGFKMLVFGQFKLDDLGGPVRIVEVSSDYASHGIGALIGWAGLLSLYLGLFNLLPIPALDGSRLVFLAYEAIRGRPVDPNRESIVHYIGFAMLMLLMIAVTYNDILRLIRG
jgi:regulator of sigma E protease